MKLSNKKVVYIAAGLLLSAVSVTALAEDNPTDAACYKKLPLQLQTKLAHFFNGDDDDFILPPEETKGFEAACPDYDDANFKRGSVAKFTVPVKLMAAVPGSANSKVEKQDSRTLQVSKDIKGNIVLKSCRRRERC
jgi:hypothetical protein